MGCSDLFHDKFEELGVLLKEYEQSINMMAREGKLDLIKTEAELSIDEKKEKIRINIFMKSLKILDSIDLKN